MMFREKSISKLYAFALAGVFALVLAGCGGGGGTAMDDEMVTPDPTPEQMCTDAGGRYNADGTCSTAAEVAAEMCTNAGGRVETDGSCTSAATLAATAAAGTKEMAIAAELAENTRDTNALNAGLGGTNPGTDAEATSDDTVVDTYSMTISRGSMGTEIKIADTAMAGDDDPKFAQAMDLGDGLTMHVRDNGMGVEEVVMVNTDIEAPEAVEFAKFEHMAADGTETMTQALDVTTDTTNDTPTVTNEALNVSNAITTHAFVTVSVINAAGFSASGSGPQTYNGDDPATTDMDEAFEAAGTYNGADGTYRCNASTTNCTVTYDSDGKITAVSDGWIFTPDAGAMSDQPDYDYLNYGFWLKRTTKDGAVTYNEVETFAGSSVDASGAITAVVGTASYEGGALGVYVKNVYNSDRTLDTATSGHFTADVSLTAYFGGNDVAVNKQNTISGTIDHFHLSGGEANSWSVALESAAASTDGTHSGTAKGGGTGDGNFTATFHGTADADNQPHTVVGEFNSIFSDGSVAGAFGARIQDDE